MDYETALRICGACAAHVFVQEGLSDEPPPSLRDYSLSELLEANELVRQRNEGSRTIHAVCDDRLVAALYVAYHTEPMDPDACRPLAVAGGGAVVFVQLPRASDTAVIPFPADRRR